MGQVPQPFTRPASASSAPRPILVGGGNVARHLSRYLDLLGLPYSRWARSTSEGTLSQACAGATHAWLAVSDAAIEEVAHSIGAGPVLVHFSGSLRTPLAHGAHPLVSFSGPSFELAEYERIPFVIEKGGPELSALLPGLPNPSFPIAPEDKARYHALCVLGGNFSVLLWTRFFSELESRFGIPKAASIQYLRAVSRNLENAEFPFTGPLARGDTATIARNLAALEGDPYQPVYRAFVDAYQEVSHERARLRQDEAGRPQDLDDHVLRLHQRADRGGVQGGLPADRRQPGDDDARSPEHPARHP